MTVKEPVIEVVGEEVQPKEIITVPTKSKVIHFDDLFQEAKDIQDLCVDYSVSNISEKMRFDAESGNLIFSPSEDSKVLKRGMTRYALSQLCTKLGVPVKYIEKCILSGRIDLASDNLNSWIAEDNRSLFVRQYKDTIRGVLSDRYVTLDTPDIMEVLTDVVDTSHYIVKGVLLSPERFHARIVQEDMLKINGEDLFAGVQIDSSDVGRSTLTVKFMIYKQVCTNGLCITKGGGVLFEQKHIGINADIFRNVFRESMDRLPVLIENSKDLIESARKSPLEVSMFSEEQLTHFTDRIKESTKLSDNAVAKVIDVMQEKYSPTKWGLVNSLTEVAQDYTLERRLDIERVAGNLLLSKIA